MNVEEFCKLLFHVLVLSLGVVGCRLPTTSMQIAPLKTDTTSGPNELRELGLWVTPRPESLPHFEAAAAPDGEFLDAQR